jgi:epoxide hydrolase-like predicted phosphatase
MTIHSVFIDFGGVLVRTEDIGPRNRQAEQLNMTGHALEKIIFESESARLASIGEINENAHWDAIAAALHVSRTDVEKIRTGFFAGDQVDTELTDFLRNLRPDHKVCLISNAWSGLRAFIKRNEFDDVFDEMIISAEVGLIKPDPRIYHLALDKLGTRPEESVFLDDVLINIDAARTIGMQGIHFTKPKIALEELKNLLDDHH